jgi:hypothetical protein
MAMRFQNAWNCERAAWDLPSIRKNEGLNATHPAFMLEASDWLLLDSCRKGSDGVLADYVNQ